MHFCRECSECQEFGLGRAKISSVVMKVTFSSLNIYTCYITNVQLLNTDKRCVLKKIHYFGPSSTHLHFCLGVGVAALVLYGEILPGGILIQV